MVCILINDLFGIFIQFLLGVFAFGTLLVRRFWCEKNKRPWNTWFKDVGKQGIGMGVAHLWNLVYAIAIIHIINNVNDDKCAWYFVNYIVDTVVGTILNVLLLKALEKLAKKMNWSKLDTGNYNDDTTYFTTRKTATKIWLIQLLSWILIITIAKLLMFFFIIIPLSSPLNNFTDVITQRFDGHDKVELIFVMIIAPMVLNIFQFWTQDIFLKMKQRPLNLYINSFNPNEIDATYLQFNNI